MSNVTDDLKKIKENRWPLPDKKGGCPFETASLSKPLNDYYFVW